MEIEYLKSAARLLGRDYVNRGCLDPSKKVLWVCTGQRAAEYPFQANGWPPIVGRKTKKSLFHNGASEKNLVYRK